MTTRGGAETSEGLAPGIGGTIVPGVPRPSTESKATLPWCSHPPVTGYIRTHAGIPTLDERMVD